MVKAVSLSITQMIPVSFPMILLGTAPFGEG